MNFAKICCAGFALASGMAMAAERVSLDRRWSFVFNGGAVQKVGCLRVECLKKWCEALLLAHKNG